MVVIVDYGVGHLFSLASSFRAIGEETTVTSDPELIRRAERIVLPGVGAFGDAAKKLRETGLDAVVREEAAKVGLLLELEALGDAVEALPEGSVHVKNIIKNTVYLGLPDRLDTVIKERREGKPKKRKGQWEHERSI